MMLADISLVTATLPPYPSQTSPIICVLVVLTSCFFPVLPQLKYPVWLLFPGCYCSQGFQTLVFRAFPNAFCSLFLRFAPACSLLIDLLSSCHLFSLLFAWVFCPVCYQSMYELWMQIWLLLDVLHHAFGFLIQKAQPHSVTVLRC